MFTMYIKLQDRMMLYAYIYYMMYGANFFHKKKSLIFEFQRPGQWFVIL